MTSKIKKFKVEAGSNLWKGLARQEHRFHVPLGELIDNSLSARIKEKIGKRKKPVFIEIIIEQNENGTINLIVADNGTGISLQQIIEENNSIFNLGHVNADRGSMNEHGFGLKNAIAMLTGGDTSNFCMTTKQNDKVYKIKGPILYSLEMEVEEVSDDEWKNQLNELSLATSGVKIELLVQEDYFKTVNTIGANPNYETYIQRLGEHLGVIYNSYLEQNEIKIYHKSKSSSNFVSRSIQAIPTPFSTSPANTKLTHNIKVEVDGNIYTAEYIVGVLDPSVKEIDAETSKGWPYPLRQYHQGSNARGGVTIISRDKVLKTGVIRDIWPKLAGDVNFNNFLAELKFDKNFPTVNQKNNLDTSSPQYQRIIEKLAEEDEYKPKSSTKKNNEESLRKKVIKQITNIITDNISKPSKKTVWNGGAEIDIFYENNDTNKVVVYELKIDAALVKDVYQLEMYWDGLVDEGLNIESAILVADSFSSHVDKVIKNTNSKHDKKGNKYKITKKFVSDF